MAMLELHGVTKRYGANTILDEVTLKVESGELIALLGPSGSGKTTILRLTAGFVEADGGEILIGGRNVNSVPPYKRNIGVVFQDYALFPHLTVFENVAFGLRMQGIKGDEIKKRVEESLEMVGLKGLGDRYPKQLSGGQQQRVAIARVVAIRCKLMLLDEPLSNLDAKLRRQVRLEIRELQQKLHITTLLVTHDQEEAMTMGDRIAILNKGKIQQIGAPMELYRKPNNLFVAGFLGTPTMNFLDCRVQERQVQLGIGIEDIFIPLDQEKAKILKQRLNSATGQGLILGIRPENIKIAAEPKEGMLAAQVTVVERLGAESLIYAGFAGKKICVRINYDISLTPGQTIALEFDQKAMIIFDGVTEKALA